MRYLFILLILSFNLVAIPSLKEIDNEFNLISEKYDIPAPLLKALAYKQSSWNVNNGKNDEMNKGMYGIMGLYQNNKISSIQYGAKLLNIDPTYGLINYKWNIEISAKILSEIRDEYTKNGESIRYIEDYYPILIDYLDYDESIRPFAENLVIKIYKLINTGYTITIKDDNLVNKGLKVDVSRFKSESLNKLYLNYNEINSLSDIEFIYTANKYDGWNGNTVDQIIIHIMQGYFEGSISWFKNPSSSASAHYLISKEGEIVQMVKLENRAWHAGDHNSRSIGIEHEGFDDDYNGVGPVTEEEYQASAMLVRWLTELYNIPIIHRDAYHDENGNFVPWHLQRPELAQLPGILGHHDCNGKEFCPGPHWNWAYYMQLLGENNNLTGEINVITPQPNEVVDNPVIFKCKVDGDIVKVKYFADNTYLLGESDDKDNDFKVEYTFTGIGIRSISFKGYDVNNNLVNLATKTHDIEIIEAGEGTVLFKTPLNNTDSVNPVILEANTTGDVVKVKYFAEDTIFLGESVDKNNNFRVIRAFNQPGNRILQVKGYNSNDIFISNAEDEVNVIVPLIDENVIEECVSECEINKEKKCNINGNVDICIEVDSCFIWQSHQECGGDEYCDSGECVRREVNRECDDECSFVNQKECQSDTSVLTCNLDSDNCLKFYLEETCQDGFVCKVGKCMDKTTIQNNEKVDDGCSYSNSNSKSSFVSFLIMLLLFYSIKKKINNKKYNLS
jgi:hypothetical protein